MLTYVALMGQWHVDDARSLPLLYGCRDGGHLSPRLATSHSKSTRVEDEHTLFPLSDVPPMCASGLRVTAVLAISGARDGVAEQRENRPPQRGQKLRIANLLMEPSGSLHDG